jgi:2-hydroxychromene-2-carboxylate isomerase
MVDPVFWYDFGSPNAYLAWRVLPEVEARAGTRFRAMPALLGGLFKRTGNQAPMLAFAGVPAKLAYEALEMRRFIDRHGLHAFTMNPHFPVNTLAMMRGAVAAEGMGIAEPYVAAMFRFMWETPRKLDDRAVLLASWAEAGLPADALATAIEEQAVKDGLAANTEAAIALGLFGLPSFSLGAEIWFGKDRLADVEAAILAAQRSSQR